MEITEGYTGGIYYIQSQGSLFNYHPHVHAIVIAGIINEEIFYEQTNISFEIITEIFRRKLLTELLKAGVITQEFVNMLLTWNHSSGFNVHGNCTYIIMEFIQAHIVEKRKGKILKIKN